MSHYHRLGVSTRATAHEIKRAYRRLARECHPDVNFDPAAARKFAAVQEAFEVLSDPARRRAYDAHFIDGNQLLNDVAGWFRRIVGVPDPDDLHILALWTVHTHLLPELSTTPRLLLDSLKPDSGKTVALRKRRIDFHHEI